MSVKRIGIASLLAMFAALVVLGMASGAGHTGTVRRQVGRVERNLHRARLRARAFMQCGFMFLEIGFSRMKNAGAG